MQNKYLSYFLITAAALSLSAKTYSQDRKIDPALYSAASIPDSLKEGANSVVRYSSTDMIVKGPGKIIKRVHNIVTVLNEKADREAEMVLNYNKKYDTFSDIEMRIYNDKGVCINRVDESIEENEFWQ